MKRPADLCRDLELPARLGAQECAGAVFREPASIPGGGIVEADARRPRSVEGRLRFRFRHRTIKFAHMCGAHAEYRKLKACPAHTAAGGLRDFQRIASLQTARLFRPFLVPADKLSDKN
jgi:hypothetical protein